MKIAIIGAGITGLSAALDLAEKGHEVDLFQREDSAGGLMQVFDFDGLRIDRFYHFLCGEDTGYFELCRRLGLEKEIRFVRSRTGFFYQGRHYSFTSPLDLLRFSPIPFTQRLRFGLWALETRMRSEWNQLDQISAKPWLIDRMGYRTWDVVWEPLLAMKFHNQYEKVSAAWIWHRIHRVARSKGKLGFLEGGTPRLLDALLARLEETGVRIHYNAGVSRIRVEGEGGQGHVTGLITESGIEHTCEKIISTVPLPVIADMLPEGWESYQSQLRRINYVGVACVIFKLKKRVSSNFWLNIHDARVPLNGIIEYTNLNPIGRDAGHIVYMPYYVPVAHPYYQMDDQTIIDQSWEALKIVNTGLKESDILAAGAARAPYGQAVCTTGFLNLIPDRDTPIDGLHLIDSVFLYPEDRSQSGQILRAWACTENIGTPH